MEIKAYGLKNHPDISSFFDDYSVNDSDDLFDAFGNQADEIDGIKFTWFHPEDDPDNVELHIWCDHGDRATIKRAIVNFLNSNLAESKASEEKMSYEALLAEALKRVGDGPFTDDDDLEDSIMSTLDAMPYDIPEGTKEALATDIFGTLSDKVTGEGDESKADEAGLSAKMQARQTLKKLDDLFNTMKGFSEWGPSFMDLYNGGKFNEFVAVPVGFKTEEEAKAKAAKMFDEFDDYAAWKVFYDEEGGPDGEAVWMPSIAFKPSILQLDLDDAKFVFQEISDVIDRYI